MIPIKCVLVGDTKVGKSWLVRSFIDKETPNKLKSTTFDNYHCNYKYKKKFYNLSIYDTSGQEDYDKLRVLSYPQTDVFIVCYAVNSVTSFNSVKTKWIPEVKQYNIPIILVGCKSDTFRDRIQEGDLVREANAQKFAKRVGCVKNFECSAIDMAHVQEIFNNVVEVAVTQVAEEAKRNNKREGRCSWLRCLFCRSN